MERINSLQQWRMRLVLGTFLFLLLIPAFTLQFVKPLPSSCGALPLDVSVEIEGEPIGDVAQNIVVKPGESVTIIAEIGFEPGGCSSTLFIKWSLPFALGLSQVQTVSRAIVHEELKITLIDTRVPSDFPDQIVRTTLRVSSNGQEAQKILTFDVKGE